jgi:hypothetical protein
MKTTTFTSSLPENLLNLLDDYAARFNVPKNRIIEKALNTYFERLKKAEYIHSFRRAAGDEEVISMAEEGLEDYLKILDRK